jgi:hypothetical protein
VDEVSGVMHDIARGDVRMKLHTATPSLLQQAAQCVNLLKQAWHTDRRLERSASSEPSLHVS